MTEALVWPLKTREVQNRGVDSTIWNEFPFRDDDIIIATFAKAGTTWMQQIVGQLVFGGDPDLEVARLSP
jgi:aryl sulfotransferase